MFLISV